jgi:hypothetical protein
VAHIRAAERAVRDAADADDATTARELVREGASRRDLAAGRR